MQGIKVELTVVPAFRKAVETKTGVYHLFNRLLDGLGAGAPEVVQGQDKVEFEMWQQTENDLRHYLATDPAFAGQVISMTTTPCP
ncbi:MAG TPA: hypothetical protein PLO23_04470 [Alphaproteobacteria bacterium]|nr:hypothetical protein [Alphaproteobacteria bacterium]